MVSGSCALPPRWPPQCSCIVIESSFDPGERLQAPGSLWFIRKWILPSSAAREDRLDYHGGSSREACKVLVIFIFSLFSFNLLIEPFLNMYCYFFSFFVIFIEFIDSAFV